MLCQGHFLAGSFQLFAPYIQHNILYILDTTNVPTRSIVLYNIGMGARDYSDCIVISIVLLFLSIVRICGRPSVRRGFGYDTEERKSLPMPPFLLVDRKATFMLKFPTSLADVQYATSIDQRSVYIMLTKTTKKDCSTFLRAVMMIPSPTFRSSTYHTLLSL